MLCSPGNQFFLNSSAKISFCLMVLLIELRWWAFLVCEIVIRYTWFNYTTIVCRVVLSDPAPSHNLSIKIYFVVKPLKKGLNWRAWWNFVCPFFCKTFPFFLISEAAPTFYIMPWRATFFSFLFGCSILPELSDIFFLWLSSIVLVPEKMINCTVRLAFRKLMTFADMFLVEMKHHLISVNFRNALKPLRWLSFINIWKKCHFVSLSWIINNVFL